MEKPEWGNKNKIYFIICRHPIILQDTEVLAEIKCSDHRLARAKIALHLEKKERSKLSFTKKQANLGVVREFRVALEDTFEALAEEEDHIEALNETITNVISENVQNRS